MATTHSAQTRFGPSILNRWSLDPSIRFLNHGSFGATPRPVIDAATAWRVKMEHQPVRFMVDELPPALAAATGQLANFLGTGDDRLALVFNATGAVNAVLASLDWRPGDEIVLADHAYPAIRNTAQHIARRHGLRVVEAAIPWPLVGPDAIVEAYQAALTARTRLVIVDHIFSPLAVVAPVERIVDACHARGARVLIDGAHAPGVLPLNLAAIGADWYVGNAHKWMFAPKACGFLHAARDAAADLHPAVISNLYGKGFPEEFTWVGTHDYSAWLALPAALDFLAELGIADYRRYVRDLAQDAAQLLVDAWEVELPAPPAMFAAMVTLPLPPGFGATREDGLALRRQLLDRHSVEVPILEIGGRLWVRVSAQVYNERADYDVLAKAILAMRRT